MSDDVIDLGAERNKRAQPDPEFVTKDEYGRPLYTFGVEYELGGKQYSFHLVAYDWADAEAKVTAIRESGRVYGQIYSEVPA